MRSNMGARAILLVAVVHWCIGCASPLPAQRYDGPGFAVECYVIPETTQELELQPVWSYSNDMDSIVVVVQGLSDSNTVRSRVELLVRRNPFRMLDAQMPDSLRGAASDRWLVLSDDGGRLTRLLPRRRGGVQVAVLSPRQITDMLKGLLHPADLPMLIRVTVGIDESYEAVAVGQILLSWPA